MNEKHISNYANNCNRLYRNHKIIQLQEIGK